MDLTVKPKYIDKPWKVTLWLYVINDVLNLPLKIFKPVLKTWEFSAAWDFISLYSFIALLPAVFLTGLLYVKSTKQLVEKNLRLKVSLYFAAIGLFFSLLFSLLLGFNELAEKLFGSVLVIIFGAVLTFLLVYFILPLGNRFVEKK